MPIATSTGTIMPTSTGTTAFRVLGTTITIPPTPTPTTRSARAPCASRVELVGLGAPWGATRLSRRSPSLVRFAVISRSDQSRLSPLTRVFPQDARGFSTAIGLGAPRLQANWGMSSSVQTGLDRIRRPLSGGLRCLGIPPKGAPGHWLSHALSV
jgi:hypothetical protein